MKILYPKLLAISLLLVSTTLLLLFSIISVSAQDDDDDDVLDVSDDTFDSDRDRRSRFAGDGKEAQMEYEDFSDEARQKSNNKKENKKNENNNNNNNNKKQGGGGSGNKKEEYRKKQEEYYKDKKSSSSSSSSQQQQPKTLTDKVALLIKTLEDVKSDFSARQNHLVRISPPNDQATPRHFNASINSERALKGLSQLVSTFGIQNIVDGDVLTRANSALASARYDARALRVKIEAAEKQQKKDQKSSPNAPAGDSLPTKDHKLIALQKNIKLADSLIDELVAEEMKQRVTHKRLLRAARMTCPTARKYIFDVVSAAEDRLLEMRGARSGQIDNAAPSGGNAREERLARKQFTQTVKNLKHALASYQTFEKLVSTRSRGGNGLTKAMEPLFIFTQLLARDTLHEDAFELFAAADAQNGQISSSSNSDDSATPFTELGAWLGQQYKTHSEHMFDEKVKEEDKKLATKIVEITGTTPSGVTFGLETGEVLGLVVCLVVPTQLFHIFYILACKLIARTFGSSSNDNSTNSSAIKSRRIKKHLQQQQQGGKTSSSSSTSSNNKRESSFFVVIFVTVFQLVLPFLLTDIPVISSRIEELPLHPKNHDITLPSVLFATLRLQVGDATQARLGCCCFLLALVQGLSVARSMAVHAPWGNDNDEDAEE